jgi:hypothetical protein
MSLPKYYNPNTAESAGDTIVEVATAVRRYKSESNLSLGEEFI